MKLLLGMVIVMASVLSACKKEISVPEKSATNLIGLKSGSITTPFDPLSGIGFVGKGDVQLALGLNNAQIQAQANNLVFTYVKTDTFEIVNAWASGNPDKPVSLNYHTETVTTIINVNNAVNYSTRNNKNNDVTGFNMTGFGIQNVTGGPIPEVSQTVIYVTFSWDEQVWTGEWTQVAVVDKDGNQVYDKNGQPKYQNGVKIYTTVTHTTDQLPAYYDVNGKLVLYTANDNKAVLSVTLRNSSGGLYVNNVLIPLLPSY